METVTLSLPSAGKAGRPAVIDVVRWLLARPDLHLTDLFVREDQCLFGSTVDGLVRFTLSVDGVEYAPDRHQMEQFLSAVFDDGWQNRIRVRALDEGLRLDEAGWCRFNGHRFEGGRLQVAIRRHPPQPLTLEAIQAPPQFRTLAQRPRGLILFVGRTSAGKSTTMAAMLQHINLNAAAHIVRIEDPLEIPIPPERSLITERQVGSDVASADLAVHDALRQRPFLRKYVHVTTPEVYGSTDEGWIREHNHFAPSTPYAVSRAACDLHLHSFHKAYGFPVVFTRAANVYGRGQQLYRIIPRAMLSARTGQPLQLHGGGYSERSFIHIRDVVRATLQLALEAEPGSTWHLSTREAISIRGLVQAICERCGVAFAALAEESGERLGKDQSYLLESSAMRERFGWSDRV